MELYYEGIPFSLQEAYSAFFGNGPLFLEQYQVLSPQKYFHRWGNVLLQFIVLLCIYTLFRFTLTYYEWVIFVGSLKKSTFLLGMRKKLAWTNMWKTQLQRENMCRVQAQRAILKLMEKILDTSVLHSNTIKRKRGWTRKQNNMYWWIRTKVVVPWWKKTPKY